MSDNRQHPRKPLHPPVAWQEGGGPEQSGHCHDISLGGMFIETENPAKYGSSVRLFITFPGREDRSEIAATVRWAKPGGMGVQFGVMGAKDTHSLTKLLGA